MKSMGLQLESIVDHGLLMESMGRPLESIVDHGFLMESTGRPLKSIGRPRIPNGIHGLTMNS